MNGESLTGTVVGLAVVVILAATLLMPALSDATTTHETFTNEGVFNYGIFETTDTYTLEFDSSDGSIEVNGTTVTPISGVSTSQHKQYSVIATDTMLLRYSSNSSGYYMQIIGVDSSEAVVATAATNGNTLSATITDGSLVIEYTADSDTLTKTFDFEQMYAIVPDADEAILKVSSEEVYILGDSELYASGLTNVTAWTNLFHFEGSYNDGITITSPVLTDATFDNIEWNIESVDGYVDLYKLTSIEFDITYNDTTVHATYSYFAVPTEVNAELSQHLGAGENALLNIIPVLIIVAIVIAAIEIVATRRD